MAVGRTNASAKGGGGIDYSTKPQITFDGKWSNWYIEFYAGVPYWEAVFYSSGTLSVSGSYTADAWGIGGGCGTGDFETGGSGYTNIALGLVISEAVSVTIGAPVTNPYAEAGKTILGDVLTCLGGKGRNGGSGANGSNGSNGLGTGDGFAMCRFRDPDKAAEAGSAGTKTGTAGTVGGGGWLDWKTTVGEGGGYGAGAGYDGAHSQYAYAHAGALVIRIAV